MQMSAAIANDEPLATVRLGGHRIDLLGTAHVSRASADKVRQLLAGGDYDAVAVELCESRYRALIDPASMAGMDLFQVIRSGQAPMVAVSLALGAYQQRMAEQLGVEPGAEMKTAVTGADAAGLPVRLIDREVGVTLKRIYRNIPWWRRLSLFAGLFASVLSREKISEAEIERLKQGDVLENTFAQFADQARDLYVPLVEERDRYMAAKLRIATRRHRRILAVIGAGHLRGIQECLREDKTSPAEVIGQLEQAPPASRWLRLIPWLIAGAILLGFGIGFARSPELGWRLIMDWVFITGGLAAVGSLIAAAHPLTVLSAFVAAPLTTLHPALGVGMITAGLEAWLRKPTVGDFSRLRTDTSCLSGWRQNRVARTLAVFVLSSIGAAAGAYIAGFRIFERLAGG